MTSSSPRVVIKEHGPLLILPSGSGPCSARIGAGDRVTTRGGGGVFYLWGAKYDNLNCVALNICTSIHFRNKYLEHVILATILV